jgi:glycopeptide antibiotics resistance protein
VGISKGQFRKHRLAAALFVSYLLLLALFVFFPRPILETGDESAIAEFIQSHANVFYKILYADTHLVAYANYLMLTPFILLAHALSPKTKKRTLALIGTLISVAIELVQRFIPGRVSDIRDLYSNVISVFLGLILIRFLHALFNRYPD